MKKIFIIVWFFTCSFFSLNSDVKYLFWQSDLSNGSVIAPIINLELLDKMKQGDFYNFSDKNWRTKVDWLGYDLKYTKVFLDSFKKFNDLEMRKKYPNIIKFLNSAVDLGPIFPHFYNDNGLFINKGLSGVNSLFMTPYFMVDIEALKQNWGDYGCTLFDLKKEHLDNNNGVKFRYISEVDREEKFFAFGDMGWYKLMLLRLKLGTNNRKLEKSSFEYSIYKELKSVFNKDVNNPWNSKHFSKNMFLQYEVAKIFEQNKNLFEKAKLVVDFFLTPWKSYQNLKNGKYFRSKGVSFDFNKIKEFLPGEEQILAYYFTQNLMLLWYGANSEEMFGVDGIRIPSLFRLFKRFAFSKFPLKENDKINVFSFIDVWKEILIELNKNSRKNWISFSGHGVLFLLDKKLIEKQLEVASVNDKELLKLLEFTIIDSCFGERMNLFYKNPSESEIKSYTKILLDKVKNVWETLKSGVPQKVH